MATNFFDQFDAPKGAAQKPAEGNFFDQFDGPKETARPALDTRNFGTPEFDAALEQSMREEAQKNAAEMGVLGRGVAAFDRGITRLGQGITQLAQHADPLGFESGMAGPEAAAEAKRIRQEQDAKIREEQRLWERGGISDTTEGLVGDIIGQAAATAPMMAVGGGGLLASTAKAAGTGAVAGAFNPVNSTRSDIEALVTGEAPRSFADEKLGQLESGAAFGAGANVVLRGAGAAAERAMKSNWGKTTHNAIKRAIDFAMKKTGDDAIAADSAGISARTGEGMTAGQASGSPTLTQIENLGRQSLFSRGLMQRRDRAATQGVSRLIDEAADDITPDAVSSTTVKGGLEAAVEAERRQRFNQLAADFQKHVDSFTTADSSPLAVADRLRGSLRRSVDNLMELRRKNGAEDYGLVDEAAAGMPFIVPNNLRATMQEIVAENSKGLGGKGKQKIAGAVQSMLKDIEGKQVIPDQTPAYLTGAGVRAKPPAAETVAKPWRATDVQLNQSHLSQIAAGKAPLSGMLDAPTQRRAAARMLAAIDQDLAEAAKSAPTDLGAALSYARGRYAQASNQIEGLRATPLGKMLGDEFETEGFGAFNTLPPEVVYDRVVKLAPTQAASLRAYLSKEDPEALAMLHRSVLEGAFDRGRSAAAPRSGGFDPEAAAKALRESGASRFGGGQDTAEALVSGAADAPNPVYGLVGKGDSADDVLKSIRNLDASEVPQVVAYLERENPDLLAQVRKASLQRAANTAREMPASMGVNTPVIRPTKIVSELDSPGLRALFPKQEFQKISDAYGLARRIGDSTGYNFPGTNAAGEASGAVRKIGESLKGGAATMLGTAADVVLTAGGFRKLIRSLADPKAREALMTINRLPPEAAKARQASAYLAALYNSDEGD